MEKLDIIKRFDIEDVVVIVAKKVKVEYHKCRLCPHISVNPTVADLYYCNKYKALVRLEDYCIEDGM